MSLNVQSKDEAVKEEEEEVSCEQNKRVELTFSWDLDTFPLLSTSRAVNACQMDLRSSSRSAMTVDFHLSPVPSVSLSHEPETSGGHGRVT